MRAPGTGLPRSPCAQRIRITVGQSIDLPCAHLERVERVSATSSLVPSARGIGVPVRVAAQGSRVRGRGRLRRRSETACSNPASCFMPRPRRIQGYSMQVCFKQAMAAHHSQGDGALRE